MEQTAQAARTAQKREMEFQTATRPQRSTATVPSGCASTPSCTVALQEGSHRSRAVHHENLLRAVGAKSAQDGQQLRRAAAARPAGVCEDVVRDVIHLLELLAKGQNLKQKQNGPQLE